MKVDGIEITGEPIKKGKGKNRNPWKRVFRKLREYDKKGLFMVI
jgi:hypothetical protein